MKFIEFTCEGKPLFIRHNLIVCFSDKHIKVMDVNIDVDQSAKEILNLVEDNKPDLQESDNILDDLIDLEKNLHLTEWEKDFVKKGIDRAKKGIKFSVKQMTSLAKIIQERS